jgi:hypothetical protein
MKIIETNNTESENAWIEQQVATMLEEHKIAKQEGRKYSMPPITNDLEYKRNMKFYDIIMSQEPSEQEIQERSIKCLAKADPIFAKLNSKEALAPKVSETSESNQPAEKPDVNGIPDFKDSSGDIEEEYLPKENNSFSNSSEETIVAPSLACMGPEAESKRSNENGSNFMRKASNNDLKEAKRIRLDEDYFQQIPNIVLNDFADKKIKALDVVIYAIYVHHVGNNGHCWPSNETVAKECGVTPRTVQNCTKRLMKAGHITRDGYSRYGTRFTCLSTAVKKDKIVDGRKLLHQISENDGITTRSGFDSVPNPINAETETGPKPWEDSRFQVQEEPNDCDYEVPSKTFEDEHEVEIPF